jgi:hypothetical protein
MLIHKENTKIKSPKTQSFGQSVLEYTMIIAVVVLAFFAIQIYMKRGMEGRFRASADDIGKQFDAEATYVVYKSTKGSKAKEETAAGTTTVYTGYKKKGEPEKSTFWGVESVAKFDGTFTSEEPEELF